MTRLVLALGLVGVVQLGCAPTEACSASTCDGCCDVTGVCVRGELNAACGSNGQACIDCGPRAQCVFNTCIAAVSTLDAGVSDAGSGDGVDAGQSSSCDNGVKDGLESDVDCGGLCRQCSAGKVCRTSNDCINSCMNGTCGAPASCSDGARGQTETDVDCGGACAACPSTKFCAVHADCLSRTCLFGVCRDPSCTDGVKNQGERDVDCGGPCSACADGKQCQAPADCRSGRCEDSRCSSCADGLQTGSETGVDCGGSCPACANGGACTRASDCASGHCENGSCCTANACGVCGALPQESCNGRDDDCDGTTDEASGIGQGMACPLQVGVCAGSQQACRGAGGWACDLAGYTAHDARYQQVETTCDGADNDCDGQTDEGLLNACRKCGAAPTELCNGVDDDCDGQTDEDPRCAACPTTVTPVSILSTSSSWGFSSSWTHFVAGVGDNAYALVYQRSSSAMRLYRLSNGQTSTSVTMPVSPFSNSGLTSDGTALHVAGVHTVVTGGVGTHTGAYWKLSTTGQILSQASFGAASNYSGSPADVGLSGAKVAVRFWNASKTPVWATATDGGTFSTPTAAAPTGDDYGAQFELDGQGRRIEAWRSGGTAFSAQPMSLLIEGQAATQLTTGGQGLSLRVSPVTGKAWVVYSESGSIKLRGVSGTTVEAAETVVNGTLPNLGFEVSGEPLVVYAKNQTTLALARKKNGAWSSTDVVALAAPQTDLGQAAAYVDSAGRVHVAYFSRQSSQNDFMSYVMVCPR